MAGFGALAAATGVCALMAGLRILYTGQATYYWLVVPNLLLAWVPYIASGLMLATLRAGRKLGMMTVLWGLIWLAFYPNASYITTDLIHLRYASTQETLYYDVALNMLAALLGWLLGASSLHGIHREVSRRCGARWGAGFAAAIVFLGAVGVYLGRVLRWNSWQLLSQPWRIVVDVFEAFRQPDSLLFIGSFTLFTGAVYAVYAQLTRPAGE